MAALIGFQHLSTRSAPACASSAPFSCSHGRLAILPHQTFLSSASLKCRSLRKQVQVSLPHKHLSPVRAQSGNGETSELSTESEQKEKIPFGYTRKDVILIGVGLTLLGVGLKYGLEFAGVDSARAGNAVQLIMVLGLTVGWISTYVFRVSSKEMTYAKQLKDYENKVMEKRLEELPEAELESLLAQIEEEKRQLQDRRNSL